MARYVCELADHESQSHTLRVNALDALDAVCSQVTPDGPCHSRLHECSWCALTATANGFTAEGRLYACDRHADRLEAEGAPLPRCEECGDAVAWPTEWFCSTCDTAIDRLEAAL
jgi:hypothetical protein